MSRSCTDAITYSGAGGGSIGAIGTNGGISLLGNKPTRLRVARARATAPRTSSV
jgi:hypothetical protein